MKASKSILRAGAIIAGLFFFTSCEKVDLDNSKFQESNDLASLPGGGGGSSREKTVGNNLSFPVIWAEGTTLSLRTPPSNYTTDDVVLNGAWWYVWGEDPIDPSSPIFSCQPNPSDELTCLDMTTPGDGSTTVYKAFLQKDAGNYWQASTITPAALVNVDSIDWGDNLESSDWSISSKVRTEVVLYKVLSTPVLEYAMRHVSGWGTDEVHGLQTDKTTNQAIYGPGTQATVYSKHARLTIQKLPTTPTTLTWDPINHYWTDAGTPVFNAAVWQAGDGPGFYNAEVNVKGKIIFGYTWDVNKLNDGAGVYRITYSFDGNEAGTTLNTFFTSSTGIVLGTEEIVPAAEGTGGTAVVDVSNNLTYIDVTITGRGKGGGRK